MKDATEFLLGSFILIGIVAFFLIFGVVTLTLLIVALPILLLVAFGIAINDWVKSGSVKTS